MTPQMNISKTVFFYPLVIMSMLFVAALLVLEMILKSWFMERSEIELGRVADATQQSIEQINAEESDMELIADTVGQISTNYRITIIRNDGKVLGDSNYTETHIAGMASMQDRAEFIQAIDAGNSVVIRKSMGTNQQMIYLAKKFNVNKTEGVIRVAAKIEDLNMAILQLRILLLSMGLLGLALLALLVYLFTRQIKIAIAREQENLELRVDQRTREVEILHRFTSMLAACSSVEDIQNVVDDIVPRIFGDMRGSISMFDASRELLELKLQWPVEWHSVQSFTGKDCWALRKGKYHISKDKYSEVKCNHLKDVDGVTLCIPLLAHGESIGIMHTLVEDEVDDHFLNIAFTVAEHLGLALANIGLQDKLREQATRDPLTKLYNRRHFEKVLDAEFHRATRHDSGFALLLIDIDHFKFFNDTFGHDAGDYVLKELSEMLCTNVRNEDTLARIGGEEIAIIAPNTVLEDVTRFATKLGTLVREMKLHHNGVDLGKLTVSMGISLYHPSMSNMATMMKFADKALYKSKDNGRDQFTVADEILPDSNANTELASVNYINKKD